MKRGKKCYVEHCFAAAPFASTTNSEIHACEKHKKRDFVNMRNKRCLAAGCYRNPHYGVSRLIDPNSKAQYCTKHKAPGMQNVNGGRCAGPNCSKQPRFSFPGEKGKYCSKHREEGMVDVLYTPCAAPGCKKHPHFGFIEGGPRFCAQHRADGMVDVKHRRCAVKGCRMDRIQIVAGCRKRGKFCELHTAEQDAIDASSEGHAITDREVSSSDGDRKRERDLKAEIEDESAYMSSEDSQRGLYSEDSGYGLYDSPSGRSIKYVSSPLQKHPSVYAERGQRATPLYIEATTPSNKIRAPNKRMRLSEAYDHGITAPTSQRALDDDIDDGQRHGAPSHLFHGMGPEVTPYPLFQRDTTNKMKLKAVNATPKLPFAKSGSYPVASDVTPFRLRCDKPTFHSSDFPSYPSPWDFTRDGHRAGFTETKSRRWSAINVPEERST